MTRNSFRLTALGALAFGVLVLAPGSAHAQKIPGQPHAETGAALAQKICTNCHLIGASGQQTSASADVPSFKEIANLKGQSRERITMSIALPTHAMPMIELTREETSDLAEYILSLKTAD
jgi:mono/diheme cytochrome c family protein